MPKRYDFGSLCSAPSTTAEGYVYAQGLATRTGVFRYRNDDGSITREYRPPSEVARADSLSTLAGKPLTNDHPDDPVTPETWGEVAVGTVGNDVYVSPDGYVRVTISAQRKDAIDALTGGKIELSCGYDCEVDPTPGTTPDGEDYDAIQRNIRYNHLAIVTRGRAGAACRVRMDAGDAEAVREDSGDPTNTPTPAGESPAPTMEGRRMAQFKIDGADFEVEDSALAVAITKVLARADEDAAKIDHLTEKVAELEKRADESPDFAEAIAARRELERKAALVAGPRDLKLDGSDRELLESALGGDLAEKSEAYVQARFDVALEDAEARKAEGAKLRSKSKTAKADADKTQITKTQIADKYFADRARK